MPLLIVLEAANPGPLRGSVHETQGFAFRELIPLIKAGKAGNGLAPVGKRKPG
ncbi:hypothetical protein GCM10027346_37910 [Hymenobacter seoulensis]